ncbi:hypothetical protein [Streptomyces sp. NPDC088757]|uniref:hypothetical protein n=1 Tax=Streptomyces sp. NPDC088757 TaxID=3365889 RepID=UPI0037F53873
MVIAALLCTGAYGPFSPDRDPAETAGLRRLRFGAGPHFCPGMPPAMAEVRVVAGSLRNFPEPAITDRRPARGVLIPAHARLSPRATGRSAGPPRHGARAAVGPGAGDRARR